MFPPVQCKVDQCFILLTPSMQNPRSTTLLYVTLLFLSFSSLSGFSTPYSDSLFNALKQNESQIEKALTWKAISKHYNQKHSDSAMWALKNAYRLVKGTDSEIDQIGILNDLGYSFVSSEYQDSALFYLKQAEDIARKGSHFEALSDVYLSLGNLYEAQNDFPSALVTLKEAANFSKQTGAKNLFHILNDLGSSFYYSGQMDSAFKYFKKAAAHAQKNKKPIQYAMVYQNLGIMYDISGISDSALIYYERSISAAGQSGSHLRLGDARMNLGTFYMERNFPTGAIKEFQLALKEFALDDNPSKIFITRQNLILVYMSIHHHKLAKKFIDQCRQTVHNFKGKRSEALHFKSMASFFARVNADDSFLYFEKKSAEAFLNLNDPCEASNHFYRYLMKNADHYQESDEQIFRMVRTMDSSCAGNTVYSNKLMLAKILSARGQYSEAEKLINESLLFFKNAGYTAYLKLSYESLRELYEAKGDLRKALDYGKLEAAYQDSIFKRERESEINFLELQSRDSENMVLQDEAKVSEKLIQSQQEALTGQRRLSISLVVVVLLILTIAVLGFVTRRKLYAQNAALAAQNAEILAKNDVIAEKNEALRENARQQANLMNVVAHDLSSPMRGVLGLSDFMLKEVEGLNDEIRDNLQVIREAAKNGIGLTTEMLQAASFKEQSEKKLTPIDLASTLNVPIELNGLVAKRKQVTLHNQLGGDITVTSNKESLQRIVDNVLSNAIKFSPKGKNVWIQTQSNNRSVTISIKDEGQGFSEQDKNLVFKPFQKLSARPTNNENSTGLGLSIVKKLVDEINGHIELVSEKGKGAEFKISIPIA